MGAATERDGVPIRGPTAKAAFGIGAQKVMDLDGAWRRDRPDSRGCGGSGDARGALPAEACLASAAGRSSGCGAEGPWHSPRLFRPSSCPCDHRSVSGMWCVVGPEAAGALSSRIEICQVLGHRIGLWLKVPAGLRVPGPVCRSMGRVPARLRAVVARLIAEIASVSVRSERRRCCVSGWLSSVVASFSTR